MNDKVWVGFAPLGAKDDVYTGYRVCDFVASGCEARNTHRDKIADALAMRMERDYLMRLNVLQQQVAKEYLEKLAESGGQVVEGDSTDPWEDDDEEVTEIGVEAARLFPGPYAAHYD